MSRALAVVGFSAAALLFALACSSSSNPPIEVADAGTSPDADVEDDAAPPTPAPGDGNTGSPCAQATDCKGTNAQCIHSLSSHEYPDGYCSAPCDPKANKAGQKNAACPGTGAVCEPGAKICLAGCTDKQGARPCRTGYLCAYISNDSAGGCVPESYSQCDLTKRGSCTSGKVCIVAGYDPVGLCDDGCDLFAQDCPGGPAADAGPPTAGCYPTAVGEGHCAGIHLMGGDGDPCSYTNDCAPGLSCNDEGTKRFCRPLCGGPTKKACTNGKTCVDLSPTADVTVAGVCAG